MAYYKTKTPRISFVPSGELRALLLQISELSGKSMASVCAGLMEETVPVLEQMLLAYRELAKTPDAMREVIESLGERGRADIDAVLAEAAQGKFDLPDQDGRRRRGKS